MKIRYNGTSRCIPYQPRKGYPLVTTNDFPLMVEGCQDDVLPTLRLAENVISQQSPLLEAFAKATGTYDLILGYMTECALAGAPISVIAAIKYLGLADDCKKWYSENWDSQLAEIDTDDLVVQLNGGDKDRDILVSAVRRLRAFDSVKGLALVS